MKSGDMVYYRLTGKNVEWVCNLLHNFPHPTGREVQKGEVLPAIVLKAYSTFDRLIKEDVEDIKDTVWAKRTFSGVADLKVFLPMSFDIYLFEIEMDDNPTPAPQQHFSSLLVYPALGKFTTVEPPPLI